MTPIWEQEACFSCVASFTCTFLTKSLIISAFTCKGDCTLLEHLDTAVLLMGLTSNRVPQGIDSPRGGRDGEGLARWTVRTETTFII